MRRLDPRDRLDVVASQHHGVLDRTGLDAPRAAQAVWATDETDGVADELVGGARAIALGLAVAWRSGLPLLPWRRPLRWLRAPWVIDRVYELVVANRHRLPGDEPWCTAHPDHCLPPDA